jgi:hypothetical protein
MEFDWKTIGATAAVSALMALITGKFLRRAVILLISPVVRKTKNKIDDQLLETAAEDLGVKGDEHGKSK